MMILMEIINKEIILKFVLSRKQNDGGFSFAQEAPSNFEDTYFALQTLYELQISYNNEKTFDIIRSVEMNNLLIKHMFQLTHLSKTYNLSLLWLEEVIKKQVLIQANDTQSIYYAAKIAHMRNNQNLISELRKKKISLSDREHLLSNLCWKTITLKKLGVEFDEQRIAEDIKEFQGYDGGFSFTRKGAPSFMEETYLAIEALSELKQQPKNVQNCIHFVERCKANNGGFGRQSVTVPTLENTYQSIAILNQLNNKV